MGKSVPVWLLSNKGSRQSPAKVRLGPARITARLHLCSRGRSLLQVCAEGR
jgi:hypothetical protein